MSFDTILFEKSDRIAYITLNRPEALNGMTFEMMDEMNQALADVQDDHGIKALVITGSGRAFSVGADITLLSGAFDSPGQMRHFLETINQLFFNIEVLPVPVIAVVNGLAWAGGFELALSCDLAIAADDAKIGDNHTNFGVMPGGGGTQPAPRKIGSQRALELIYTARWLTGKETADYGIVLRSAPADKLDESLEELLADLREKSRDCLGFFKRAVVQGEHLSLSPNPPMRSGLGVRTRGEGRGTRRSALDSDKWGRWRPLVVVGGADGGPGQRRWGGVGGTVWRGRQSRTGPVRLCGAVG